MTDRRAAGIADYDTSDDEYENEDNEDEISNEDEDSARQSPTPMTSRSTWRRSKGARPYAPT